MGSGRGAGVPGVGRRREQSFDRLVLLPGWSDRSRWGFDPVLESYWVELWREGEPVPAVSIGTCHLIVTVAALARAVAHAVDVAPVDAYVALTARHTCETLARRAAT